MCANRYARLDTALRVVDPYNAFLSEGAKLWPLVQGVAQQVGLLDNLRSIIRLPGRAGVTAGHR